MKILLTGNNKKDVSDAIFEGMKRWPMYKTLSTNIRDVVFPDEKAKNISDDFLKSIKGFNDDEKTLMYKNYTIGSQYDKYKKEEFMFFNGGTIDVLIDAIIGNANGKISEKVVTKCIYYNKKLLRNIDVVYWIPDTNFWKLREIEAKKIESNKEEDKQEEEKKEGEENIEVTLTEEEQLREQAYWNLLQDYQFNIEASPYFDSEDSPLFAMIDGDPVVAMSEVIGNNGRLAGESISPEDEQRIQELLKKSPEYLQALKEGIAGTRYNLDKI